MNLPFKPHYIALICSAGLLAAAGTLFVKSREPAPPEAPPAAAVAAPVQTAAPATYTVAQITQWVAPVALYPDPLLSQVLMASTYPENVIQAVQWSKDHPGQQGDAAVKAVASQPWDVSVKPLVAFPQLTAMMAEDPQWVENLGNAFLAQPQDVMDAVQKLRQLAQQTGSLKSTPQQTVTTTKRTVSASSSHSANSTPTVIKIESSDPQIVYVPNYNPTVVYGSSWPYTSAPPVYLPPPPGEQFAESFVKGFGYSLGVATTYAIFSNIDWDDDDHHHHDDDDHHHGGGDYQHNGDNININVNNFNKISGQNIHGETMGWQHNPIYRDNVPYQNKAVSPRFHQTDVSGGLSSTARTPATAATRDSQRQAAMTQLQQHNQTPAGNLSGETSRDSQRNAASRQLNHIAQRNNYRGYDETQDNSHREALKQSTTPQQRSELKTKAQQHPVSQPQRENIRQHVGATQLASRQNTHSNVFSGNDSRSPSWQSQQRRGQESRRSSNIDSGQRAAVRENISEHRELRHR